MEDEGSPANGEDSELRESASAEGDAVAAADEALVADASRATVTRRPPSSPVGREEARKTSGREPSIACTASS